MCASSTWLWKHPDAYSSDSRNHPVEIPYLIHSVSHWTGSHYVAQVELELVTIILFHPPASLPHIILQIYIYSTLPSTHLSKLVIILDKSP